MTDIVERLRRGDPCGDCKRDRCACVIMEDAADEIERLRDVLKNVQHSRVLQGGAIIEAINEIDSLQAALNADPQTLRLHLGEMSAQEMRTLRAGFQWVLAHAAKKEK